MLSGKSKCNNAKIGWEIRRFSVDLGLTDGSMWNKINQRWLSLYKSLYSIKWVYGCALRGIMNDLYDWLYYINCGLVYQIDRTFIWFFFFRFF